MEDIIKNGGGFNKFTIKNLNDDFKSNKYIVEVGEKIWKKIRIWSKGFCGIKN